MGFRRRTRYTTLNFETIMDPENTSTGVLPVDTQMILDDTRASIKAIQKNSKLREHYLRLGMMNNIMRAFIYLYHLEGHYAEAQKAFLKALVDVEGRKNRAWFKAELALLDPTFVLFDELLGNATEAQLQEVIELVAYNRERGKWCVHRDKNGKVETAVL